MVEKQSVWHEIASVQDNGRQHIEKESVWSQWLYVDAMSTQEQGPYEYPNENQKTRLRKHLR